MLDLLSGHTQAETPFHENRPMRAWTQTQAHMDGGADIHEQRHTNTMHGHRPMHTRVQAVIHMCICTHIRRQSRVDMCTHICSHTCTYMYAHAQAGRHVHMYTCGYVYTHAVTHTHTCTHAQQSHTRVFTDVQAVTTTYTYTFREQTLYAYSFNQLLSIQYKL